MRKSILFSHFLVLFVVLIVALITTSLTVSKFTYDNTRDELISVIDELTVSSDFIDETSYRVFLDQYDESFNIRITVVQLDGTVIYDTRSDASEMENHYSREEIKTAIEDDIYGYSIRNSETISIELMYVAKTIDFYGDTVVLRISRPINTVRGLVVGLVRDIIIGVIIGVAIAYPISIYKSKKVVKQLEELNDSTKMIREGSYDIDIKATSFPEIDELGRSFSKMGISLKQLFDKINSREAELMAVINSLSDGLIVIDEFDNVILYNDAIRKLYRVNTEIDNEPIYKHFFDKNILDIFKLSKNKDNIKIENVKNSEAQGLSFYSTHIKLKDGKRIGTLLLISDVTDMKKLENMRRDFVSNVTHELKTPLTSILGFTETLKTCDPNEQDTIQKFLTIIEFEAERLKELINELLILQEIEEIREVALNNVDIISIIRESIDLLEGHINEGVELKVDLPKNDVFVYANTAKLKQIIINLLSNSFKYTTEGNVEISIVEKESTVEMIVSDTGIGIPNEDKERVFERFYRVDKARNRKTGGTGLGLSIVKHLVEMLNGTIYLESKLEVGTTITVVFNKRDKII